MLDGFGIMNCISFEKLDKIMNTKCILFPFTGKMIDTLLRYLIVIKNLFRAFVDPTDLKHNFLSKKNLVIDMHVAQ